MHATPALVLLDEWIVNPEHLARQWDQWGSSRKVDVSGVGDWRIEEPHQANLRGAGANLGRARAEQRA